MDLYGRNFLTLKDFSKEEIRYFLDLAHQLKKDKKEGKTSNSLAGKNIVLLFEKTGFHAGRDRISAGPGGRPER